MIPRQSPRPWWRRFLIDPLEVLPIFIILGTIRLLPVDWASGLGGWLGRTIGPRLSVTKRARINLRLAFPDISRAEQNRIIRGMWDNLGRIVFEYPHLGSVTKRFLGRIETINPKPLRDVFFGKRPTVFCAAHLANFEVVPLYASRYGVMLSVFARAPNNPLVSKLVNWLRGMSGVRILGKSATGALEARSVMMGNGFLGALVDQKNNRGVPVNFFGHQAMTAVAPARLALRFKADVLLCRIERIGPGARFRLTLEGPLSLPNSGDLDRDSLELTQEITRHVESWIRAKPEDWLWLHRRWPRSHYGRHGKD